MFNLNLKIILRNLWKDRITTLINLLGLTLGITAGLIILLYTQFEESYDQFHVNSENIYRIRFTESKQNEVTFDAVFTAPPLGPACNKNLPEVVEQVRFYTLLEEVVNVGDQNFEETGISYADPSVFNIFSIQLQQGDQKSCLTEPSTAVISTTIARKYFGDSNPINETFSLNRGESFIITGVFEEMPANSHFHFDILLSYNSPHWLRVHHDQTWDMHFVRTYLLVRPDADIALLEQKISGLLKSGKPAKYEDTNWKATLQPLEDIHLYSNLEGELQVNGNHQIIQILKLAGILVIIIAWINYINLSTAKALRRAKTVGIQKVLGISKLSLVHSYVSESLVLNVVAAGVSLGLVVLFRPMISSLIGLDLTWTYWTIEFTLLLVLIFFAGAVVASLYPAFTLTTFNPIYTIKGILGTTKKNPLLRKSLIVFQFVISAVLISATIIIFRQTNYMLHKDLGINISNTLVLKGMNLDVRDSVTMHNFETFKKEVSTVHNVIGASSASTLPSNPAFSDGVWSDNQDKSNMSLHSIYYADPEFAEVYDLELVAGRNFSDEFATDADAVMINETSARQLGFLNPEEAIGHKISRDFGSKLKKHIVGVVRDFHESSLENEIMPVLIYGKENENRFLSVKYSSRPTSEDVKMLEKKWYEIFGNELFRSFELEESYRQEYQNEELMSRILTMFAVLTIFVASIGLFGLAYFTIVQRTKEIGIRKVVGASILRIINLINYDFIKLVLVASVIAVPLSFLLGQQWLKDYAYRVELQWWVFILPFLLLTLITVLTISFFTIKTALEDPVKALKHE